MQFGLTETQQMLQRSAREFFLAECPMAEVRRLMETPTAHDSALWRKIAAQGWTGILCAEQYDGQGLGMVELAALIEEMGRALVPGPFLSTLVAAAALDSAATDAQKQKYLAPICSGDSIATLALLEASARWDLDAVQMQASSSTLTGCKLFVPDAGAADFLLCAARSGGDLALFLVDSKAQGLTLASESALDATRKLYQVAFDNVAAELVASGDRARRALERALDLATAALVAEMAGGMQRVLEISVAYAKTRKQFGKPIGQFQAVQHHCADMFLLTESSRSAAYYAAWALQENVPEAQLAVSIAKAYASEAYREVGNRGIQIHGGMGFTWENDLHLYYRRAKASEIAYGDAAFHRERIARLVIDRA